MIRRNLYLLLLAAASLSACKRPRSTGHSENGTGSPKQYTNIKREKKKVALLPFSGTQKNLTGLIQKGLGSNLFIAVTVLPEMQLPASAFYQPRRRYIADSLLMFLKKVNNGQSGKIIGITTSDISTRKGKIANWGILGLGNCPGTACVISSFRAGKGKVKKEVFEKRMITLSLHELGHTYGLKHCPDQACLMKDAEGKMNLDDAIQYCESCKKLLSAEGVLK